MFGFLFFPQNSNLGSVKTPSREPSKSKLENVRASTAIKITDKKVKQLADDSGWGKAVRNAGYHVQIA